MLCVGFIQPMKQHAVSCATHPIPISKATQPNNRTMQPTSLPQTKLQQETVTMDRDVQAVYAASNTPVTSMWDLYQAVWQPFGKLLTDLETTGMLVDRCVVVCAC